jgi:DNA invertase Pin-like site-specific DNA recombinase
MKNIETFENFINDELGNEVSEKMNAGFKAYLDKQKAKREAKSGDKSKSKAKPDFLDLDKDGDKEETMKKAAADKKENDGDTTKTPAKGLSAKQKTLPKALQAAILKKQK